MKQTLVLALFSTLTSSLALAAPAKICFGAGDAKGSRFVLQADEQQAVVSQVVGDDMSADGSPFKIAASPVSGRDGKTYLDFPIVGGEGENDLLVDADLLQAGTQGLVKVRARGESFGQSTYFCRDNQ